MEAEWLSGNTGQKKKKKKSRWFSIYLFTYVQLQPFCDYKQNHHNNACHYRTKVYVYIFLKTVFARKD